MTLNAPIEQCTSALVEEFGDALRVVAIGDGDADEYEIRHIRDDIAQQYPPPDRREIFEDALLEALACDSQEELFRRGKLEYTVRVFERGINVLCWIGDRRMLFVGLDRDPSLISETIARVKAVS